MANRIAQALVLGGALAVPATGFGAVSLTLSDLDATPAAASAAAGTSFTVHVLLNETATTDRVSGIDYQMRVSDNGSGKFRLTSRTSTSLFTPAVADSSSTVAPVTFAPTNGNADLGGDRNGNADVTGPGSYDTAAYTIMVLAGTANGTYTFSFVNPTYSGTAPSYPTSNFASVGTFTVTVPEPAAAGVAAAALAVGLRRRRAN